MPVESENKWRKPIENQLFAPEAHNSRDQSNVTAADIFSTMVRNLIRGSDDREEMIECVLGYLRKPISQDRTLLLINYVLEELLPLKEKEIEKLKQITVMEGYPENNSARGYVLRFVVQQGAILDWEKARYTPSWKGISKDSLLACDILVMAGEFSAALRKIEKDLRTKIFSKTHLQGMTSRWKDRLKDFKGERKTNFTRFVRNLQERGWLM